MLGKLWVIQPVDFNAGRNLVPVGAVHQFQPVAQDVITADEITAHADGPTGGGHVDGKVFLNLVNDLEHIPALAVHLVTEGQDWQVAHAADLKQLLGLALHALCAVNHHDSGVDGRQRAVGIFREIGVAGGIYQIEPEGLFFGGEIERHGRCRDGNAAVFFHRHKIGSGAARLAFGADLSGHLDRTTEQQEFLCQCGFTCVRVADNRERPAARDLCGQGRAVMVCIQHHHTRS